MFNRYFQLSSDASEQSGAQQPANEIPAIAGLPRSERLFIERQILARHYPSFEWEADGEGATVEGPLPVGQGRAFLVRVVIPAAYPFVHPKTFVISPIRSRNRSLVGASHDMHTLRPDADGHPQPCLYDDRNWTPSLTLYHVLVKAQVWLHGYDQHRITGNPICDFLPDL